MLNSSNFNNLAIGSLMVASLAANQGAFAHTRLEIPTVPEGTTVGHAQTGRVFNQVVISHGCPPAATRQPTFGTSVVFPNAISYTPIIGVNSNNTGVTAGLAGAVFTTKPASSFYSPLAGIGQIIRTGGPWEYNNNKADALGNVDGFWAGGKNYDQSLSTPSDIPLYPYAITITSMSDGKFIDINDAFTAISGYSRQEALSDSSIGLALWVDINDRNKVIASERRESSMTSYSCVPLVKTAMPPDSCSMATNEACGYVPNCGSRQSRLSTCWTGRLMTSNAASA